MFFKYKFLQGRGVIAGAAMALLLSIASQAQALPFQRTVKKGEYLISRSSLATLPLHSESDASSSIALQAMASTANAVSTITLVRPEVGGALVQSNTVGEEVTYDADEHQAFCDQLRRDDSSIEYCEPNYIYTIDAVPADTDYNKLWGMQKISAPSAWELSTGSEAVLVAVVDTGIDYTHPDLAANAWVNPGEIAGNHVDDDHNGYIDDVHGANVLAGTGNPYDDNSHGTHVSGTIGGVGNNHLGVSGVNWNVRIMGVKFLNSSGSGTLYAAIEGINYAVANGARVINASWGGGGYSQALYDSIRAAKDAGVLFVAAAGNSGLNNDVYASYPASYDLENIVAVAATGQNDRLASFSNYGVASVDVAAPGVDIYSTVPGGYATYSGTSMATPHVAGLASLLLAVNPTLIFRDLKARIMDGDSVGLSSSILTGRRINAYRALTSQAAPGGDGESQNFSLGAVRGDYGRKYLSNGEPFSLTFYGNPRAQAQVEVVFRSPGKTLGTCTLPATATDESGYGLLVGKIRVAGALRGTSQIAVKLSGNSLKRRFKSARTAEARRFSKKALKRYATMACNSLTASIAQSKR